MTEKISVRYKKGTLEALRYELGDKTFEEIVEILATRKNIFERGVYTIEDIQYCLSEIKAFRQDTPDGSVEDLCKLIQEYYDKTHKKEEN